MRIANAKKKLLVSNLWPMATADKIRKTKNGHDGDTKIGPDGQLQVSIRRCPKRAKKDRRNICEHVFSANEFNRDGGTS